MNQTLIDGIANIAIQNGVVRIDCVAAGADGQARPSGTLVIPGAIIGPVLNALVQGVQELDKKLREQVPNADEPK